MAVEGGGGVTVDDFRDLVESIGGTVHAARTHVAKPDDWPNQRLWPFVRVEMRRSGSERFCSVAAPTFRACCETLRPWVEAQARLMEARGY
jgi:hypothetical protein